MPVWIIICICWVAFGLGLLLGNAGFLLGMSAISKFENEIEKRQKKSAHSKDERKEEQEKTISNTKERGGSIL